MKKSWMIAFFCVVALSLTTGTASAKAAQENGKGAEKKVEAGVQVDAQQTKSQEKAANGKKVEQASQGTVEEQATEETQTPEGEESTDTQKSTKPGHNGYKGLLNAIQNVKDKPAGAVLADLLLTKYDAKLTDEMKAELTQIKEEAAALSKAADLLEQEGSVTDAVYLQEEAVLADFTNIESYKKLGKLYDKLGKKGVKLFVNGEQPTTDVAPIVQDGSTLVPFRAISEALQAEVAYNPADKSITVTKDGVTLKLIINSKTAYVNGEQQTLDAPATVINGSTVVPVRFISEAFEAVVQWEPSSQSVVIYNENTGTTTNDGTATTTTSTTTTNATETTTTTTDTTTTTTAEQP
ncbi:copper amine oxidase N-terminal domain-containing protein [Paenibacillus timonensis]|uniref:Copper amine oxidase N-terminal domain-containing protein n=1 Tax=Paenibacillus timonensis TaxID=225915 RepID=A0ABW3S7Y0_9BACL|nr:copper amine oxidase N-terminal domain-containing protein [Paenibacillus timonensis]MCH1639170.1 copper amine oxidase N-terminal domain-containing protein [Paenibacillus timonensis]